MYLLETNVDWTAISAVGSLIAAFVATIYTIITALLLRKTNQTAQRTNSLNEFEIYRQISSFLSTDKSRKILRLCAENKLEIKYSNDNTSSDTQIDSSDINLILNSFEDLDIFRKKKLISIDTINEGLGYKILELGNCQSIVQHISKMRNKMPNVFSGFEELYNDVYKVSNDNERSNYKSTLFPKEKVKSIAPKANSSVDA